MKIKKGSCLCENIKYSVKLDDKLRIYNCHCIDCRKKTGNAFITIIELRKNALNIDISKLDTFSHPGKSGQYITKFFCNKCASPVYSYVEKYNKIYLYSGLLEEIQHINSPINIHYNSHFPFLLLKKNHIHI
tara:strand:- start:7028 stop:7423 length:396 start_codon:yes stop_codon:yes gene_type:complete